MSWSIVGILLTGNTKFWQKNLSQCHFVYRKSSIHWPGIEACNLSHGMVTSYYGMTMTTRKLSYWHEINLQRSDNYCTNFIPVPTNVKEEVLVCNAMHVSGTWGLQCCFRLHSWQIIRSESKVIVLRKSPVTSQLSFNAVLNFKLVDYYLQNIFWHKQLRIHIKRNQLNHLATERMYR